MPTGHRSVAAPRQVEKTAVFVDRVVDDPAIVLEIVLVIVALAVLEDLLVFVVVDVGTFVVVVFVHAYIIPEGRGACQALVERFWAKLVEPLWLLLAVNEILGSLQGEHVPLAHQKLNGGFSALVISGVLLLQQHLTDVQDGANRDGKIDSLGQQHIVMLPTQLVGETYTLSPHLHETLLGKHLRVVPRVRFVQEP